MFIIYLIISNRKKYCNIIYNMYGVLIFLAFSYYLVDLNYEDEDEPNNQEEKTK